MNGAIHRDTFERSGNRRKVAHLLDRKSTRLNSSHSQISYAVFCLKKKKKSNSINAFKKTYKRNSASDIRNRSSNCTESPSQCKVNLHTASHQNACEGHSTRRVTQ